MTGSRTEAIDWFVVECDSCGLRLWERFRTLAGLAFYCEFCKRVTFHFTVGRVRDLIGPGRG
jgi:hypothetical protein